MSHTLRMTMTAGTNPIGWTEVRDIWIKSVKPGPLLYMIGEIADLHTADTTPHESIQRAQTIMWLATRGKKGTEHGHATPRALRMIAESARAKRKSHAKL